MDSLLASYASSDEEEEQSLVASASKRAQPPSPSPSIVSSFFSSLPQPSSSSVSRSEEPTPKNPSASNDGRGIGGFTVPASACESSSGFASIRQPKGSPKFAIDEDIIEDEVPSRNPKTSSVFSGIPRPQAQLSGALSSVPPPKKKVVQFRPPVIPVNVNDDVNELEEEKETKKRRQTESSAPASSTKSLLSMMPAPRRSSALGAGAGTFSMSGSNRRSIIETEAPPSNSVDSDAQIKSVADREAPYHESYQGHECDANYMNSEEGMDQNAGYCPNSGAGPDEYWANCGATQFSSSYAADKYSASYVNYDAYGGYDRKAVASGDASGYRGNDTYGGYASYGDQFGNNMVDGSMPVAVPMAEMKRAKRRKNEIPSEIVEVKQDELMKNRPREDKAKMTGLAFGPAYQPVSSAKGKPSKLHKRKHQINSLYFDMKQKEMELAERRSKGLLTKAETQAKYGW